MPDTDPHQLARHRHPARGGARAHDAARPGFAVKGADAIRDHRANPSPTFTTNHSGGPAHTITPMQRARRFLVMGSDTTFYQAGGELTAENAESIAWLARTGHSRALVDLIVDVSVSGGAAKQSFGLFALALVQANTPDATDRAHAYRAVDDVCRTLSTLMEWAAFHRQLRGTKGPAFVRAVRRWLESRDADELAYQAAKYRRRHGWTLRDLARIAHPRSDDPAWNAVLRWSVRGELTTSAPARAARRGALTES